MSAKPIDSRLTGLDLTRPMVMHASMQGWPGLSQASRSPTHVLMSSVPRSVLAIQERPPFDALSVAASRSIGRGPDFWASAANAAAWQGTGCRRTAEGVSAATSFESVFLLAGPYAGETLLEVLQHADDQGRDSLARHLVAAALNVAKGWTPHEVMDIDRARDVWASFVTAGFFVPAENVRWYCGSSLPAGAGGVTAWLKSTMS